MRSSLDFYSKLWLKEAPEGETRYVLIFRDVEGRVTKVERYTANTTTPESMESLQLVSSEDIKREPGVT